MRTYLHLTILLALLSAYQASAQTFSVKGSVADTLNNDMLAQASVTILQAKDSVLQTFTRAKDDGSFELNLPAGKYVMMVTYPAHADYVDVIEVKDKSLDLGQIPMVSKTHLLKEFVLTKEYAAIKVKGDTVEYVADSFKVRDNATVESLLKKLPGIQVDKNGKIVAQGEEVKKVLVDGEEFFSDDPAVVTKSLQAKSVDKVQVYDKKSDQAEFTGIDDGEKTKTINLQLKDNKKKGYFGKAIAAGGAGDKRNYFENQLMLNAFRGKRQLSAFGIMSNTGKVGLGWEDRDKYSGGDNNTVVTDDGDMYTYYSSDDGFESWDGKYNGQGLPRVWTGGLHYADKWNQDKQHVSSNYRYSKQDISTSGNTFTQYTLPDSVYYTNSDRKTYSQGQRNRVDVLYDWKIDTTSSLKITANGNYSNTKSTNVYNSQTLTEDYAVANSSTRTVTSDATSKAVNATLDYRKKFKKKGRTVSLNVSEKYNESQSDGYLKSVNSFAGAPATTIDQHKESENATLSLSSRLSYTEPLSKVAFLEFNYNLKVDNNNSHKNSYNKTNPLSDSYDSLDAVYSNSFKYNILTNTGGSNLRFVFKKINFSAGGAISNAAIRQMNLVLDTSYKYSYTNFFPSANFTYKFSKQTSFSIRYSGNTQQPTLTQIQPLKDNVDPLNVAVGNPNLKQEFDHNINLSYNDYKVLTGRYIWASLGTYLVNNDISRSDNTDAFGRRTYQYINVNGNYNIWGYLSYGFRIKKLNLRTGAHINPNVNHTVNFVNGVRNISDNKTYSFGLDFNYETKDEKFSFSFSPGGSYNDYSSTINTLVTNYWTSTNEFDISYEFPFKLEIGTDFNWFIRQKTAAFTTNNNVFKWNAYVSQKFLKNDQLELRATVFDILNQNVGFSRNAQSNYITQDNYNTIRRYGLLSLIWNFTKSAKAAPAEDAQNIIEIVK